LKGENQDPEAAQLLGLFSLTRATGLSPGQLSQMDSNDVEAMIQVDTARKLWLLERLRALAEIRNSTPEAVTARLLTILVEEKLGP